jgi:uncharacterized protein YuzE
VRITYDPGVDAAYIYLTDEQLPPGRDSIPVDPPKGIPADIVLDWKDGKLVANVICHGTSQRPNATGIPAKRLRVASARSCAA